MATWGDVVSLIFTLALFVGVIAGGMFVQRSINATVDTTKKTLKEKGVDISEGTVRVKTAGRYSHEEYIDSTSRAFIRGAAAMSAAGSFGHADDIVNAPAPGSPPGSQPVSRKNSAGGAPPKPAPRRANSASTTASTGTGIGAGAAGTASPPSAFRAPTTPSRTGSLSNGTSGSGFGFKRTNSAGSVSFADAGAGMGAPMGLPSTMSPPGSPEPEERKKKGLFSGLKRRTSGRKAAA